jgi:tellurite methyltransferase
MKSQYDQRYRETQDYFGSEPSELLERCAGRLPAGSAVLDVGVGQGRNCLPLARRGWPVVGIDTSRVALHTVGELAEREDLPVQLWHGDFRDYEPGELRFGAVLAFGLLQTLDRRGGASLLHRAREWTRPGGLLLLTAWHVDDPGYARVDADWEKVGLHCYRGPDGELRTYLARGEILDLMLGWSVIHHWEGIGPVHRHGDGVAEQHGIVELVAVKP